MRLGGWDAAGWFATALLVQLGLYAFIVVEGPHDAHHTTGMCLLGMRHRPNRPKGKGRGRDRTQLLALLRKDMARDQTRPSAARRQARPRSRLETAGRRTEMKRYPVMGPHIQSGALLRPRAAVSAADGLSFSPVGGVGLVAQAHGGAPDEVDFARSSRR